MFFHYFCLWVSNYYGFEGYKISTERTHHAQRGGGARESGASLYAQREGEWSTGGLGGQCPPRKIFEVRQS